MASSPIAAAWPGYRYQVGEFGLGPVDGCLVSGEDQWPNGWFGQVEGNLPSVGVEHAGKRSCGMQVPGEQAADGGNPLGFRFADLGAFGGIDVHQVMELVSVPAGFLKQVSVGQGFE